jgi:hypothetical protein
MATKILSLEQVLTLILIATLISYTIVPISMEAGPTSRKFIKTHLFKTMKDALQVYAIHIDFGRKFYLKKEFGGALVVTPRMP